MDTIAKIFGVGYPGLGVSKLAPVKCSNPTQVMGVELETENARHHAMHYHEELQDIWTTDRDGSLRGEGAFEFISRPLPLTNLLAELQRFFDFTKFTDDNYTDRCSVHVHTNVTDMTQDQVASLCMTYTVVEEVLFQFINHFNVKDKQGACRDTNLYCIPWNQCRLNHKLVETLCHTPSKVRHWQKYTALNLLPMLEIGTVEWRQLHGTADMEKISKWLNIIGSIMEYSKKNSLDEVIKTVKTLNDTSAYQQFFDNVLQGHLTYTEEYQKPLFEGVINAKYSLMDFDKDKKPDPAKKSIKTSVFADWIGAPAVDEERPVPRTNNNNNPFRADTREWWSHEALMGRISNVERDIQIARIRLQGGLERDRIRTTAARTLNDPRVAPRGLLRPANPAAEVPLQPDPFAPNAWVAVDNVGDEFIIEHNNEGQL